MGVAQRSENLRRLDGGDFDVLVIGGGINGAVSAAALAGRGMEPLPHPLQGYILTISC